MPKRHGMDSYLVPSGSEMGYERHGGACTSALICRSARPICSEGNGRHPKYNFLTCKDFQAVLPIKLWIAAVLRPVAGQRASSGRRAGVTGRLDADDSLGRSDDCNPPFKKPGAGKASGSVYWVLLRKSWPRPVRTGLRRPWLAASGAGSGLRRRGLGNFPEPFLRFHSARARQIGETPLRRARRTIRRHGKRL
jgi:hypothetical protein